MSLSFILKVSHCKEVFMIPIKFIYPFLTQHLALCSLAICLQSLQSSAITIKVRVLTECTNTDCRQSIPHNMSHKCRRLEGKVAIVTAATKGIGLAIAVRLAEEGANVVISSRTQKNVDEIVEQFHKKGFKNVKGTLCHVAKPDHQKNLIDFTIKEFGKIDILVNNHGINPAFGSILDVEDAVWDKLYETNVKAGWQLTKLVQPIMAKNGGGNIIFNASYGGYKAPPGIAAYGVTKTAVIGLTKALAMELAKDNIRVNGIAPGVIKTKMSRALWDGNGDEGEQAVIENTEVKLGRLGVPEDCAGAVAFLVSDDANYITGEMVLIAGGVHARL